MHSIEKAFRPTFGRRLWLGIAVVVMLGVAAGPCYFLYRFLRPSPAPQAERNRIEAAYAPVLSWIDVQYSRAGGYPRNLPAEYTRMLKSERLKGKYFSDGKRFQLSFGNYLLDGYVIFWSSNDGVWRIDG